MLAICASFRASSLIGNSDGLITTTHTSPCLFCHPSSCTYNSHIKKRKFSCVLCAHSQLLCRLLISNCQLGVRHTCRIHSDRLLFDETFTQPCVFTLVKCADVALNVFYSPILTRFRIFLQLWAALSQETADNLRSLQWHIVAHNDEESACRIICTRTPQNGGMAGALPPLPLQKGYNGGGGAFS